MNFEDVELEDLSTNSNDKTKLLKKKENEDNSLTVSCYIGYFIIAVCIFAFFIKSIIELVNYINKNDLNP